MQSWNTAENKPTSLMTLNWTEIKTRAAQFAADFSRVQGERGESQTFWNRFFEIFGIERRRVAVFESKVKKLNGNTGFIDLLWPGVLLVEHKSLGQPLGMAQEQAENYFINLKDGEHPRFIVVCDFQNFWLKDLDLGAEHRFSLPELPLKISLFGFCAASKARPFARMTRSTTKRLENCRACTMRCATTALSGIRCNCCWCGCCFACLPIKPACLNQPVSSLT